MSWITFSSLFKPWPEKRSIQEAICFGPFKYLTSWLSPLYSGVRYSDGYCISNINTDKLISNQSIYSGDPKSNPLKYFLIIRFLMVWFSKGWVVTLVPTISKPDKSNYNFCPDFKWLYRKWQPFVQISEGQASRFQIPFKIWTICKQSLFWPFEIQTCPNFRSPLQLLKSTYPFQYSL